VARHASHFLLGGFLVVAGDPLGDDVWAQFVSASGVPEAVVPITTGVADAGTVGTASDGTDFLIVYFRRDLLGNRLLFARRLSSAGSLLGSELSISTGPVEDRIANGVAFDGANYFVVWMETSAAELRGRFISPAGALGSADRTRRVGG